MALEEVLHVARMGAQQGAAEALFTLGECSMSAVCVSYALAECSWQILEKPFHKPVLLSIKSGASSRAAPSSPIVCPNNVALDRMGGDLASAGDKPELLYPEARQELRQMGYDSTLEYVARAAAAVMEHTGLLPHINAGVMGLSEVHGPFLKWIPFTAHRVRKVLCDLTRLLILWPRGPGFSHRACGDPVLCCGGQVQALRQVSAGQGLMLETSSRRLMQEGMPHHDCPDKVIIHTAYVFVSIDNTQTFAVRFAHKYYSILLPCPSMIWTAFITFL